MSKCFYCGSRVYFNEEIKCLGKSFHESCFKCAHCAKRLALGQQRDRDGLPFCASCYNSKFAPKGYGFGMSGVGVTLDVSKAASDAEKKKAGYQSTGKVESYLNKSIPSNTPVNKKPVTQTTNQPKKLGIEDLEKLASLRDKGIITEEEFHQKKKQILNSL